MTRSEGRRTRRHRWATATVVAAAVAGLATGCVGRLDRNDDHVGPYSPRPDAREHTQAPPSPAT